MSIVYIIGSCIIGGVFWRAMLQIKRKADEDYEAVLNIHLDKN